jgi:Uma2 family endonuclease
VKQTRCECSEADVGCENGPACWRHRALGGAKALRQSNLAPRPYASYLFLVTAPALSIDGDRVRVPATALSHAGFREWVTSDDFPQSLHAAFVAGEVLLDMSPEAIISHNQVKGAVTRAVGQIVDTEDLGRVYPDGALLTHLDAEVSTEPDMIFASWATLESKRLQAVVRPGRQDSVELSGTPDLVVEVVSDSSRRKDLILLREAYGRAGVSEYWLIDARGDSLRFEILLLGDDGYVVAAADQPQRSRVFDRFFRLERMRDRLGEWRYRLLVC